MPLILNLFIHKELFLSQVRKNDFKYLIYNLEIIDFLILTVPFPLTPLFTLPRFEQEVSPFHVSPLCLPKITWGFQIYGVV